MTGRYSIAALALLGLAACDSSPAPAGHTQEEPDRLPETAPDAEIRLEPGGDSFRKPGPGGRGLALPEGLVLGGDCPEMNADADAEIAAQATARVPLVVGLTLTKLWKPTEEEEYECFTQVTAIGRDAIDATTACNSPKTQGHTNVRLCRADFDSARMLHTGYGSMTVIDASGEDAPETYVGATLFSLSRREFAELKQTGSVRHRYVQSDTSGTRLDGDSTAILRLVGTETAQVAINDGVIEVPVIRASGEASHWYFGEVVKGTITALIMDDERFPFLVDYVHMTEKSKIPRFRLNYAKISYPGFGGEGETMERGLAENKRIDVYGIYFDFNSDRIRRESEPILAEIGVLLRRNPDWILNIVGHTDAVGGDAYNLDLSSRRSEAVRKALVDRFGVAPARLTSGGLGAAAPKDTNDTPEGRARNRRVELVRQ